MTNSSQDVIACFKKGDARVHVLEKALEEAWPKLVRDPEFRAKVAKELSIPESELSEDAPPPFSFTQRDSGLTGGEIALMLALWAGDKVFLGAVTDEAKAAVRTHVRRFVEHVFLPALRKHLPGRGDLGDIQPQDRGSGDD